MSNSNLTLSNLAIVCGKALGDLKKVEASASALKETINKSIAELHSAKAKVGTYKKDGTGCPIATAFVDGCMQGGLSQSTAQKTYLPTFKKAVASGKPVGDWNSQRAKNPKNPKGGKASEPKSLANKLATCYRDGDFEGFIIDLQASFENDEGDLIDLIKSYLEIEGIVIKEKE